MPAIDALPPAPQPTDDTATFNAKAFAVVGALNPFVTQTNAAAAAMSADASASASASASAVAAKVAAESARDTAVGAAGAVIWVTGTSYALGAVVWSPINRRIYRRIVAGAGSTDPSADATNWAPINAGLPIDGSVAMTGALTAPGFVGPLTGAASANLLLSGGTLTGNLAIQRTGSGSTMSVRGGSGSNQGAAYLVTQPDSATTMVGVGDRAALFGGTPGATASLYTASGVPLSFDVGATERMYLHPAGLRIGGSGAPLYAIDVKDANASIRLSSATTTNAANIRMENAAGTAFVGLEGSGGFFGGVYTFNVWHQGAYAMAFGTNNIEGMRLDPSSRFCVGTKAIWTGLSSRLNVHYAGVATENGLTLNTPDVSATQSRAINFLAGGDANGGSSPFVRGHISQNSSSLTLNAAGTLVLDGVTNVNISTAGSTRVSIDSTGVFNYGSNEVGFRDVPPVGQNGNYTLGLTDRGRSIDYTGTGGHTVTIPANGSVAFPVGSTITICNTTANNVSISITTDTLRLAGSGTTGTRTLGQYGMCTLRKIAATTWLISGAGLT